MYTLLQNLLRGRLFNDGPVQIGIVGAGKFGTGLAVQLASIDGINVGGAAARLIKRLLRRIDRHFGHDREFVL